MLMIATAYSIFQDFPDLDDATDPEYDLRNSVATCVFACAACKYDTIVASCKRFYSVVITGSQDSDGNDVPRISLDSWEYRRLRTILYKVFEHLIAHPPKDDFSEPQEPQEPAAQTNPKRQKKVAQATTTKNLWA